MLTKLRTLASLYRELGPRWVLFRLAYAFRLRTGGLRRQMPKGRWSDYRDFVTTKPAGRAAEGIPRLGELPSDLPWRPQTAIAEADRLLDGEIKYFAHEFVKTGFPPNWHKDHISNVILSVSASSPQGKGSLPTHSETLRSQRTLGSPRLDALQGIDMAKHWSEYSDDIKTDIKFIWEPNRFAFVYTLVRAYAATRDEKYPEAFWTLIEDWAEHNPPNTGPNWMDGQEIALRLMAWTFGYHGFLYSPSTTQLRISQFTTYISAHAEHIYQNRAFAIFTRGNHAITEAFGLWMVGLLFPELKNAEKYLSFGKLSLEREARAQLFPDGTYSMFSLNYHRFVLHIYLYALQLAKLNNISFSDDLKKLVTKSIETLSQIIDPQTGQMPVYGSNDGALVLPLNNCDFTDYRPLLQLGWYLTKGERLFEPGPWDEDMFWFFGESAGRAAAHPALRTGTSLVREPLSFPHGGIHLLRNTDSCALIRCTDFTSRPSHADQLHVDLWMCGHNLGVDAGTYLYSGEGVWRNGLARTSVHNTVTVDSKDQMTLLSRFTWINWSRGKVLKHGKDHWQGEHDGYKPVSHKRTVMTLEGDRWLVIDNLFAKESHHYTLQWLLGDYPYEQRDKSVLLSVDGIKHIVQVGMTEGSGEFSLVRADPNSTRGWRSRYYGHREPAISVMLDADRPQVTFWTLFGVEGDRVELSEDVLKVNAQSVNLCKI